LSSIRGRVACRIDARRFDQVSERHAERDLNNSRLWQSQRDHRLCERDCR
jgi:hypothetical protein